MNRPAPRARQGAHRTTRDLAAALVPSLLAVLAVAALATALYVWRGQEPEPDRAVASTNKASTAATPSASTPRSPSSSPATSRTPTATPTASASQPAETSTASTAARLQVVVLNQTRRAGLAEKAAQRLRARGWVVRTGNFRGQVSTTTVYYPAGARRQALAVAAALPTAPRVRERFGNLSDTRLTVVVTDSYPA